jgi:hypothetical protein
MGEPVPTAFVNPGFVYQCHEAPVPSDPPVTLTVVELPALIFAEPAAAPEGGVEDVFIVTTTALLAVAPPQAPVTLQAYVPAVVAVSVDEVAPGIAIPPFVQA